MNNENLEYNWSENLIDLPDNSPVKITMYDDYAEAVTRKDNSAGAQALASTRRISKTQYVDADGVINDYNIKCGSKSAEAVKESIKKIRLLIQHNFKDFEFWHITLTYSQQVFDFSQAAKDFENFYNNRLTKHYNQYKFGYLRIIEPHENGAWHIHILLKSAVTGVHLKLSAAKITEIWGLGTVKARQVSNTAEMVAYFGTVHRTIKNDGHKLTKTEKKQLRWHYYPTRARIFAKSDNIAYPPQEELKKGDLSDYLAAHGYDTECIKQASLEIIDPKSSKTVNRLNYQTFCKSKDGADV